jgi:DNA-binding CsgD family transcriptional regulator
MEKLHRIIEQVYSAALDGSVWPSAVRSLQRHFGCASAGLYIANLRKGSAHLVHVNDIDPTYVQRYIAHFLRDNPWSGAPELQAPGKIRSDWSLDAYYNRAGYYRSTAYFNEWMKPQDFIYTLGTNLSDDGCERTKLYLYRAARTGPFSSSDVECLQCLSGHLTNAVEVASRVAQQATLAKQTLHVLERTDFGVVLLDEDGGLIEANGFAEGLFAAGEGLRLEQGAVVAAHPADAARLARALRDALELRAGQSAVASPRAIALRGAGGRRWLRVHAIPLSAESDDPFCRRRPAVALVLASHTKAVLSVDELGRLYGLTPAESRLVQSLLSGANLRQASERTGVKYETARWYLKNIFQKTGVTRQAELVRRILADRLMLD